MSNTSKQKELSKEEAEQELARFTLALGDLQHAHKVFMGVIGRLSSMLSIPDNEMAILMKNRDSAMNTMLLALPYLVNVIGNNYLHGTALNYKIDMTRIGSLAAGIRKKQEELKKDAGAHVSRSD